MHFLHKPTPEFWRTVLITVLVGFGAGALGAVIIWSRLDVYEAALLGTNQPIPLVTNRRSTSSRALVLDEIQTRANRSVVTFFEKKSDPTARYLPEEAVAYGAVFTSDGWLITHTSAIDPREHDSLLAGVGALLLPIERAVADTEIGVVFMKVAAENLEPVLFSRRLVASGEQIFVAEPPHVLAVGLIGDPRERERTVASDVPAGRIVLAAPLAGALGGSPLFDERGEVVGITVLEGGIVSRVVPIPLIEPLFDAVLSGALPVRPTLGVHGLTLSTTRRLDAPRERGFLVAPSVAGGRAVDSGSPSAVAGVRSGDIILKLNDELVNGAIDLAETLLAFEPGDTVELTIVRNGDELVLPVTLGSRVVGRDFE